MKLKTIIIIVVILLVLVGWYRVVEYRNECIPDEDYSVIMNGVKVDLYRNYCDRDIIEVNTSTNSANNLLSFLILSSHSLRKKESFINN